MKYPTGHAQSPPFADAQRGDTGVISPARAQHPAVSQEDTDQIAAASGEALELRQPHSATFCQGTDAVRGTGPAPVDRRIEPTQIEGHVLGGVGLGR